MNIYSVQEPPPPGAALRAESSLAQGTLRILLAEDNKVNQKFAAVVLNKAGYSVEVVENGHQAVDAVRDGQFDVVLMDIQMPELDGSRRPTKFALWRSHGAAFPSSP